MAAELIHGNKDDATAGLDLDGIANALNGLIANSEGELDRASPVSRLSQNRLGEVVGAWLRKGENSIVDQMLGGGSDPMEMLGKIFH